MDKAIQIVLVDDHPMVVKGLNSCLGEYPELHVVATMESGEELLERQEDVVCDVVLLDVNLPGLGGIDTARRFLARETETQVLIFSMLNNPDYARHALDAGARGYLLKDAMPDELVTAIKTVAAGGSYFSRDIAASLAKPAADANNAVLTDTERAVLGQIAEGKSSKEIAREAGVSVRTTEAHRRNIKLKLGAQTAAECVQIGIRSRLI